MVGRVKKFNLERGFGFIQTDNEDYFFHATNFIRPDAVGIDRKPVIGERVYFEVGPAAIPGKQKQAIKVRPVVTAGLRALAKGAEGDAGGVV